MTDVRDEAAILRMRERINETHRTLDALAGKDRNLESELAYTSRELEAARGHVVTLRSELDRQTTSRRAAQDQVDDLAHEVRHLNWRINQLRAGLEAIRSGHHDSVQVAREALVNDGPAPVVVATVEQVATAAATLTEALGYRERAAAEIVQADAWCEYWQRECADARAERDELEEDGAAALKALDLVLADDGYDEDTGEPDDPGSLVDAAESVVTRLRNAEDINGRLSQEIARLRRGERPLPGAPELTGGAR